VWHEPEVVLGALHVALHDLVEALDEPGILVDTHLLVRQLQVLHHLQMGVKCKGERECCIDVVAIIL
jgi:hypothetical protein